MTDPEAYAFLENTLTATLGTIGPGGYPHQVNMMHAVSGEVVEFTAFTKSQKVLNIVRNPRASFLAEVTMPYSKIKGAMFVGDVEVLDDYDEVVRIANEVAKRFQRLNPNEWAINPQVDIDETARKRMALRLHVKRIVSWDHSKLGGTY